jgi:hypothetical protein
VRGVRQPISRLSLGRVAVDFCEVEAHLEKSRRCLNTNEISSHDHVQG